MDNHLDRPDDWRRAPVRQPTPARTLTAYGLSLAAVALALVFRLWWQSILGDRLPFITVFPAIVFAAWYGGKGPALLSLLASSLGVTYFVLPPNLSLTIEGADFQLGLILFNVIGLATIAMFESLRTAQQAAEDRQRQLEREAEVRIAVEKAGAAQAELLRTVTDYARVGLVVLDDQERYTFVNPAYLKVLGLEGTDIIGRKVSDLLGPLYRQVGPRLRDAYAGHRTSYEMVGRPQAGQETRAYTVVYEPQWNPEKSRVIGVVAVVMDVTERKRIETALKEADRRKDEFLATISHELRTPLSAILGWSALLLNDQVPPQKRAAALATIKRSAEEQSRLIDDLLDVSRIMTGRLRLRFQSLDLREVVGAAIETVRPAAEAKGLQIRFIAAGPTEPIVGDAPRLQQVVWNLLTNAVKFTPRGGRIEITTRHTDSSVEIEVHDTGQGITPQVLPHIFDRFRQGDSSSTRRHGGLGLGLAIVRELVHLHGGTVVAESPGEGQGATFRIRLPQTQPQQEPVAPDAAPADVAAEAAQALQVPAVLKGLRVLVVDDNQDTRDLLLAMFETCGCEVRAADSADAGLTVLRTWEAQILVSDIGMPVTDGYAFIEKVRQEERDRPHKTPAIALTAYARAEDRLRALQAGYQAYVAKPVNPAELLAVAASLATTFVERSSV